MKQKRKKTKKQKKNKKEEEKQKKKDEESINSVRSCLFDDRDYFEPGTKTNARGGGSGVAVWGW